MRIFILILLSTSLWAQDDIQSILERDPFDPNRGQEEEVETEPEEEEEEVAIPDDVPVLDGTIILGDVRIAMFSFKIDGQPVTARVEMKGGGNDYMLYVRQPKNDRGEATISASGLGEPNGKLGVYTVAKIETNQVELRRDGGGPVPLEMYLRDAKDRGGSKAAPAELPLAARRNQRPEPVVVRTSEGEGDQAKPPEGDPNPNARKPTFRRRLERGNMSDQAEEKKAQIKKKF